VQCRCTSAGLGQTLAGRHGSVGRSVWVIVSTNMQRRSRPRAELRVICRGSLSSCSGEVSKRTAVASSCLKPASTGERSLGCGSHDQECAVLVYGWCIGGCCCCRMRPGSLPAASNEQGCVCPALARIPFVPSPFSRPCSVTRSLVRVARTDCACSVLDSPSTSEDMNERQPSQHSSVFFSLELWEGYVGCKQASWSPDGGDFAHFLPRGSRSPAFIVSENDNRVTSAMQTSQKRNRNRMHLPSVE